MARAIRAYADPLRLDRRIIARQVPIRPAAKDHARGCGSAAPGLAQMLQARRLYSAPSGIRTKSTRILMTTLIKPFRGLRPAPGRAADVIAPPYDVLNSAEARERARGRPLSFLHISKPEIDLPETIDVHDPRVYAKGAENFRRMIEAGVLIRDRGAALLRLPPAHGCARADGPRLRRQRRGLRRQPHPQARVHAPGQGRRPRAPDRRR